MTTARVALILGIAYLGAALLGFIPAALTPPDPEPAVRVHALHGKLLGLFPVNLLHDVVHLVIGLWGVLAAIGKLSAVVFLRVLAVFYGALAVMGLFPQLNTMFGLIPIHGHDVWLHAATALVAGWFGFRASTATSGRAAGVH